MGVGALGETLYYNAISKDYDRSDGRAGDYKHRTDGHKMELKTDTYDMTTTENFFMEYQSDKGRAKPGGPFQAQQHGCKYYTYFYIQNLRSFTFEVDALVGKLNQLIPSLTVIEIPNTGWVTTGFKVNRDLLKDIYKEFDISVKLKEMVKKNG